MVLQDQYDYLVRVMEQWRDGFPTDGEKRIFVANVFKQMEGDERWVQSVNEGECETVVPVPSKLGWRIWARGIPRIIMPGRRFR